MFPCDICHKTFDKYKNLFRHVKTHKVSLVVVTMVTYGLLTLQHFDEFICYHKS